MTAGQVQAVDASHRVTGTIENRNLDALQQDLASRLSPPLLDDVDAVCLAVAPVHHEAVEPSDSCHAVDVDIRDEGSRSLAEDQVLRPQR